LFGEVALEPGMDLATKDHLSSFGAYGHLRAVQLGASLERLLYLLLDLGNLGPSPDAYKIVDADDARQVVHGVFRLLPLELPIDFTGKRHDALFDLYRDLIGRNPDAPSEDVRGALGDFIIRSLLVRRKVDLDLLRDRPDKTRLLARSAATLSA
jgi:hypothetical protein